MNFISVFVLSPWVWVCEGSKLWSRLTYYEGRQTARCSWSSQVNNAQAGELDVKTNSTSKPYLPPISALSLPNSSMTMLCSLATSLSTISASRKRYTSGSHHLH